MVLLLPKLLVALVWAAVLGIGGGFFLTLRSLLDVALMNQAVADGIPEIVGGITTVGVLFWGIRLLLERLKEREDELIKSLTASATKSADDLLNERAAHREEIMQYKQEAAQLRAEMREEREAMQARIDHLQLTLRGAAQGGTGDA